MDMTIPTGLVCPLTREPVAEAALTTARIAIAQGNPLATRRNGGANGARPIGETESVLLRQDGRAAYPIVSGVPVLLAPEVLTATATKFDLVTSHYAEAYNETGFYDASAASLAEQIRRSSLAEADAEGIRWLDKLRRLCIEDRATFPYPYDRWLASRMDLGSEWDRYRHIAPHIAPVKDQRVLQLGGTGVVAISLLLAGAREGMLVTPMIGEARLASALADACGVQLQCAVGIAEEIPLPDASFDVVYSGGCVHHMTTEKAFPEIARVLRPGGRFAALEPWRAPLYSLGTLFCGKREANPCCRPLTHARVAPLFGAFPSATIVQHGTLTRYPMLALEKLGARFPVATAWQLGRWDDLVCSFFRIWQWRGAAGKEIA
jgi:ubiquinone/menaquinone biosynthesis C-methylase UbiE/uncharacterized protein YbaR (Trm112 family)